MRMKQVAMQPLKYITFLKIWQPIGQQGQMKKLILLPPSRERIRKKIVREVSPTS